MNLMQQKRMKKSDYQNLFDSFYTPLLNFAIAHISQKDVAEDIVQEIFIHMYCNNITCENELVLRNYLYRSVLNRCRNYIRDQRIHDEYNKTLYQEDEINNTVLNSIISEEVYRQLSSAVEHLPPQCRKIYEMFQDGLKPSEIAEQLGLAVETIKKQRKIAKKILQDELGKYIVLLVLLKHIELFQQ